MLKRDEVSNPNSCLNKAAPDEPVFVLRANDKLAGVTVRGWALKARENGLGDAKFIEAMEIADKMDEWPTRKLPD